MPYTVRDTRGNSIGTVTTPREEADGCILAPFLGIGILLLFGSVFWFHNHELEAWEIFGLLLAAGVFWLFTDNESAPKTEKGHPLYYVLWAATKLCLLIAGWVLLKTFI